MAHEHDRDGKAEPGGEDLLRGDDHESGDLGRRSPMIAEQLRTLMLENGIKSHRQVSLVAELLKIKGRTARRKLYGETVLDEEEITRLLDNLGYEYRGLRGLEKKDDYKAPEEDGHEEEPDRPIEVFGDFMGEQKLCRVWVKDRRDPALAVKGVVLIETEEGKYELKSVDGLGTLGKTLLIDRIEIDGPYEYEGSGKAIAVVEPDQAASQAMSGALFNQGFKTTAIWTKEMLTTALTAQKFDAFLVGWVPWSDWDPSETASEIRTSHPIQPILFVTNVNSMEAPQLQAALDMYVLSVVAQPASSTGLTRAVLREIRRTHQERRDDEPDRAPDDAANGSKAPGEPD